MNIECQEYDPQTGRIICTHNVPEESYNYMRDEMKLHLVCGSGNGSTHYVSDGKIAQRPVMELHQDKREIAADGKDTVTLSGLPTPCNVTIGREEYEVPDGVFEWSTFLAGSYPLKITAFPYIEHESEVVAVESGSYPGQE